MTGFFRMLIGDGLRTVESESRCDFGDTFGDPRNFCSSGAGLAARARRDLLALDGASVEIFDGHANLIVQTRFGGSGICSGEGFGFAASSAGLGTSFRPHANEIHRFRPKVASTTCSPGVVAAAFCNGPMISSSCRMIETGSSKGFLLKIGTMLRNVDKGSGGLGVLVLVPGLVRPPSLVSSAVEALLLLHVETHDIPRLGPEISARSSVGELVFECNALVKSDSLRAQREGVAFEKNALKDSWSFRPEGRGVRSKSGGSSTSAKISSSAEMVDAVLVGKF